MNPPRSPKPLTPIALAVSLGFLAHAPTGSGATRTWVGRGPVPSWSYVADPNFPNWQGNVAPSDLDLLEFGGAGGTSFNDLLGFVTGLTFLPGAGPLSLTGGGLKTLGNITNVSGVSQTITLPITVAAPAANPQVWDGGASANGSLTVNNLTSLDDSSLTLLRKVSASTGVADLVVGKSGTAALTIQGGSSMANVQGWLGYNPGSNGTATVTGAGSIWTNRFDVVMGALGGNGSLNIAGGGHVSDEFGRIGEGAGSSANATITGVGSTWANSRMLYVGNAGNGTLRVENGGLVSDSSGLIGQLHGSTSSATVSGPGSVWANSEDLFVAIGGDATLRIENGGAVRNGLGYIGYSGSSTGTAIVTGLGSNWSNTKDLIVGERGKGTLTIESGGAVFSAQGWIGHFGGSSGTATVTGTGSTWTSSGDVSVGIAGSGTLNIADHGSLNVGTTLGIGAGGVVNLQGGSLAIQDISIAPGGQFNWQSGNLTLPTVNFGSPGPLFSSSAVFLNSSQHLAVTGNAFIASGAYLGISGPSLQVSGLLSNAGIIGLTGGGTLQTPELDLNGGGVSGTPLAMDGIGHLKGHGTVAAAVTGGAASIIEASGGNLSLGDLNRTNGFQYGGILNVGSRQVMLLDQDIAELGGTTSLADGGKLGTFNGALLSANQTLSYSGHASILGNFTNHGHITATGSGATLTFLNDVNGSGDFSGAGATQFHAGYSPGDSPARIDYHGTDVSFDPTSTLTLELFGPTPGMEYDQLAGIDHLAFNGSLDLVFGNRYAPKSGDLWTLLLFQSFSGSFDPNRILVTGFDRNLLDFSQLGVNGTLRVTAPVPLPPAFWLFGSALVGLGVLRRRRVGWP